MAVGVRVSGDTVSQEDVEDVRLAAERALEAHQTSGPADVTVVLTDDAELRELNRRYRDTDRPTDVLSFPMDPEDTPPGEIPYAGDVVISVERAARATAHGHPLVDELRLLAVHGVLHLLGFEDETPEGIDAMRRAEFELGVRDANDLG